jgi:glutaredoxin
VTVEVRIYSAAGCHLCDVAKEVVAAAQPELGFELVEVDIAGDPELEAAYREHIPVVFVGGRRAFTYRVDRAELRRCVRAAAGAA